MEASLFAEGSFSLVAKLGIGSLAVSGGRRAAARGSFGGEVLELARAQLGGARGSEPGMTALTAIATLRVELANDWLDYLTALAAFFAAPGTVAAVGWAIYEPGIRERRWRPRAHLRTATRAMSRSSRPTNRRPRHRHSGARISAEFRSLCRSLQLRIKQISACRTD